MKISKVLTIATLVAITSSNMFATDALKQRTVDILEKSFNYDKQDLRVLDYISDNKYVQHNQMAYDGKKGFIGFIDYLKGKPITNKVIRVIHDGKYVATHSNYNLFGEQVIFDIFKFEDGKAVEHWDNAASLVKTPNKSGHTQLDGPTNITDIDKTQSNKALVKDFIQSILIKGEMNKLQNYFDENNYIQHNTIIEDGLSGLGKALGELAKQGTPIIYTKNHMIIGEGNFVLSVSEGKFGSQLVAYYDLFRVENGKIAEHWDTIENILPKEKWKNTNGKF